MLLKNPFPPDWPIGFGFVNSENDGEVFPAETALCQELGPARRRDFILGRLAAHQALDERFAQSRPILRNNDGAPNWPSGVTGSIAHSAGVAIAVVASTDQILSIGIDLELKTRAVVTDIFNRVSAGEPNDMFGNETALTLFAIKEAGYKALRPLTSSPLGFADMKVRSDGNNLCSTVLGFPLSIVVSEQEGFILTGVYIPATKRAVL